MDAVRQEAQSTGEEKFLRGAVSLIDATRYPPTNSVESVWPISESRNAGEGGVLNSKSMETSIAVSQDLRIKGVVYEMG